MRFSDQERLAGQERWHCQAFLQVLGRSLLVFLGLVVAGVRAADIPNAIYQPPQGVSAADQRAALDQLDRFVAKLSQLTTEIDRSRFDLEALLDREEFDEQKIIAFVRDEISFEQYPGLLRGAQGTLISGAGNALDQALLLATLLRDVGLDARIVRGRIDAEQDFTMCVGFQGSRSCQVQTVAPNIQSDVRRDKVIQGLARCGPAPDLT